MSLQRFPDWPERLTAFLDARREMPFAWGSNDCALFAADAILEMTGVDVAKRLRGYKTEAAAARRIKKAGGMKGLALSCGGKEKPVGFAQRGEIVIGMVVDRETFGVVSGDGYWRAPGADGSVFRPMSEAIAAIEF